MIASLREDGPAASAPPTTSDGELDLDGWLTTLFGERLAELDALCAAEGPAAYPRFADLDDDLWALLLSRQYTSFPGILGLLPDVPEADLQRSWNGLAGLELLTQSKAFYRHAKDQVERHGATPLGRARVLDFGCGWGRLTRFFARDVAAGSLLGCDPTEAILEVCRRSRVPAELARSESIPEALPFDGIDLAYSFSVFTHISEAAADTCVSALHRSLNPGGLLILTIRPPAYLEFDPKMGEALAGLGSDPVAAAAEPRYVFVPHPSEGHPQYDGGEMTYGEAVISLPYVRERWGDRFELADVHVASEDIYQVTITLRRRD